MPDIGDQAGICHRRHIEFSGKRRLDDRNLGTGIDHEFIDARVVDANVDGYLRIPKRVVSYWRNISRALGFPENASGGQKQEREGEKLLAGIHRSSPRPYWRGELCALGTALS